MVGTPVIDVAGWNSETLEELVGMELTPSRLKYTELALVAFRKALENRDNGDERAAG